ncbi:unnamed protein product [Tuber aestivum]|uniref:Uncharacterized protein n=1 Tax=Tuber aestivum TaxID=59557 RepID=A0A292PLL6_9PEZI|nr:unnamed protein product [Tuber aestivum]
MVNGPDPHHLAALITFATLQTEYQVARDAHTKHFSQEDSMFYEVKPKIRTFPILDTFARISVSQERSESIAIALQLHRESQVVHLTIAGNDPVRGDLAGHLTKIWGKLQVLSSEYAKRERRIGECGENGGTNSNETVRSIIVAIFREIHEFSIQKLVKRVKKWWRDLVILVQELCKRRGGQLQGIELNLMHVVTGFAEGLLLLDRLRNKEETPLTEIEWETIYKESAWAYSKARLVLADGNGSGCENLAKEFQDTHPGRPFQLRRALEKLTSLTRHAQWLTAYAKSPHLRFSLRYQLSVSVVPQQTRTVILPTSQDNWNSILEAVGVEFKNHRGSDSRLLFEHFHEINHQCPVHCECKVIQHLEAKHKNQWDIVAPCSYIAVSKPTCAACKIWIEAFNRLGGRKFHVRGSDDGKWVWPWAMPTLKEESLEESLVGEFSEQYLVSQRVVSFEWDWSRSLQPSSWSSTGGAYCRPTEAELLVSPEARLRMLDRYISLTP